MKTASSIRARVLRGVAVFAVCGLAFGTVAPAGVVAQEAAPVIVVETTRGSFAFETYPNEAPLTVAHVVDLVKQGFYDGQRVHRALPGFLVQFGDPQTRDLSKRELWGRGQAASSGKPIGVAEMVTKRTHTQGAVAMAHQGDPTKADSQIYVTLAPRKDLDGRYSVFGQVIEGIDVPAMLRAGDEITRMFVKP
jgi:peptidyl-prolyl cis-trans isomerase B (cyclophilin B)